MKNKKAVSMTLSVEVIRTLDMLGNRSQLVNEILESIFKDLNEYDLVEILKATRNGKSAAEYLLNRYISRISR